MIGTLTKLDVMISSSIPAPNFHFALAGYAATTWVIRKTSASADILYMS